MSGNGGFFMLVGLVSVLGVGVGGAFVGGMAVGKAQAQTQANSPSVPTPSRSGATTTTGTGTTTGAAGATGAGLRSQLGNLDPTQIATLREQFAGQGGTGTAAGVPGGFTGGAAGAFGGALSGAIESITATSVTVNTPSGPLQATIDANTRIIVVESGEAADLAKGVNVMVVSTRDANGNVIAQTIMLVPADLQELVPGLGGGARFGGGARTGGGRGGAFGGAVVATPTP